MSTIELIDREERDRKSSIAGMTESSIPPLSHLVAALESYLRDFGLADAEFVAIESRKLLGQAMVTTEADASEAEILLFAIDAAWKRHADWASDARLDSVAFSHDTICPACNRTPIRFVRQQLIRPASSREPVVSPAVI